MTEIEGSAYQWRIVMTRHGLRPLRGGGRGYPRVNAASEEASPPLRGGGDQGRLQLVGRAPRGYAVEEGRMSLPYRYELLIRVEIKGDGLHADGDGARATADRLAALLDTDSHVIHASAWSGIEYKGKHFEPEPKPKDGEERQEPWGSGMAGSKLQMITLRYSAEDDEWLAVGEARQSAWDGNTAVRYDLKTSKPDGHGDVPICDALGGHVGWVSWEAWSSWPVIETEGEST
jgi:hypothetical protein